MFARMLIAAALVTAPAFAQDKGQNASDGAPKRVRSILLYGDDQCPKTSDPDEIVVCANAGESPYRIPKQFRDQPKEGAAQQAWTNRVESVQELNRVGLPGSCSPVGIAAQTGCTRKAIQEWAQERVNARAKQSRIP